MPVRIAFDMDGVLADFDSAFRDVELRLFGTSAALTPDSPEGEAQLEEDAAVTAPANDGVTPHEHRRRRQAIWHEIHRTTDFWTTLRPLDPAAVARIRDITLRRGWEVFFMTRRPATAGETVQRQTQRWLVDQGFDLPSVLVIGGSRGAAARALRLDFHVDDSPRNCLEVAADSDARAILIVPDRDDVTERSAERLRLGIAHSVADALDMLEELGDRPSASSPLFSRLSRMIGWE